MQLKALVPTAALIVSAFATSAQRQTPMLSAPSRIISVDTIILPKAAQKPAAQALMAMNAPVAKPKIQAVPLAGQKSYFGGMNDYVTSFVRTYFGAHNRTLSVVKDRSVKRFSLMDNVLAKHAIPKELKYLAVIESALNNNAISHCGAVGPWQLMEGTARLLGLTVNGSRDDRTDWAKSTNAAAKYLNQLYGQLNDWLLVVAAYNSGPTPVHRAIARTGSRNFWDIKKYLPRETQGHVLAFIATASIFEKMNPFIGSAFPSNFSFGGAEEAIAAAIEKKEPPKPMFTPEELASMAIVRINEPVSLEYLGQELGIERKLLAKWNPDYDLFVYDTYTEPYYGLRIPKDKLDDFVAKKEQLMRTSRQIFAQNLM
jgi:membrane-bound lytic murein transglycosylase D